MWKKSRMYVMSWWRTEPKVFARSSHTTWRLKLGTFGWLKLLPDNYRRFHAAGKPWNAFLLAAGVHILVCQEVTGHASNQDGSVGWYLWTAWSSGRLFSLGWRWCMPASDPFSLCLVLPPEPKASLSCLLHQILEGLLIFRIWYSKDNAP